MKIGIRLNGPATQQPFADVCQWAASLGIAAVDTDKLDKDKSAALKKTGLSIGTLDIWANDLISDDPKKVAAADKSARETIDAAVKAGAKILFTVFLVADPAKGRAANFELWKKNWIPVIQSAEKKGLKIVIEGWPGPDPYLPALGCAPETLRAIFAACPSPALGINYDPSHLVRLGIDYLRFLREFGSRIYHCHGKDTALDAEWLYLTGTAGPSLTRPPGFGQGYWRYCIPGDGIVHWLEVVRGLEDAGFNQNGSGIIAIELEDYRYWKDWANYQEGVRRSVECLKKFIR
jgi:sugar phosphate isomerase/epimerase